MTSIINVAGIGLADRLLNAQTLGHEQRAVAAQARRVLTPIMSKPFWWRSRKLKMPW